MRGFVRASFYPKLISKLILCSHQCLAIIICADRSSQRENYISSASYYTTYCAEFFARDSNTRQTLSPVVDDWNITELIFSSIYTVIEKIACKLIILYQKHRCDLRLFLLCLSDDKDIRPSSSDCLFFLTICSARQ